MTLEEDLNAMCSSKKLHNPVEVSRLIHKQIELINSNPKASVGKSTAENLLRFCKTRSEYKESYPYIEGRAKHYLSLHGYIERLTKAFYPKRK